MALAGRCSCGVRLDLAAMDPDVHLICNNQKRCLKCEQVKSRSADFFKGGKGGVDGTCKACRKKNRVNEFRRQYQTDPIFRDAHRERVKLYKVLGPKTGKRRPQISKGRPLFRWCPDCNTEQSIDKFQTYKRYRSRCSPCFKTHQKGLNSRNPNFRERRRIWCREWWRRNRGKSITKAA